MDNSIVLAKFIGPFIILIAVGVLFNIKIFRQIMEDFLKSPGLIYITGLITFVAGLAIVLFHNIWTTDWRVLITAFGWISVVKGALLTILPGSPVKLTKIYMKNINLVAIPWAIMLLIGIFLTLKGYIIK